MLGAKEGKGRDAYDKTHIRKMQPIFTLFFHAVQFLALAGSGSSFRAVPRLFRSSPVSPRTLENASSGHAFPGPKILGSSALW